MIDDLPLAVLFSGQVINVIALLIRGVLVGFSLCYSLFSGERKPHRSKYPKLIPEVQETPDI